MERSVSNIGAQYAAVVEDAIVGGVHKNYGAYLPDVPGCVATGATVNETLKNLAEALDLHLSAMERDGDEIPDPLSRVAYVSRKVGFASMGSAGGKAAAARMTKAQRIERARKAGKAGGRPRKVAAK